eukprot:205-Chlamydomonas_euryale.AAC.1
MALRRAWVPCDVVSACTRRLLCAGICHMGCTHKKHGNIISNAVHYFQYRTLSPYMISNTGMDYFPTKTTCKQSVTCP